MTPITFKEASVVYAENQPEYQSLPVWRDDEKTISCWELTWRERLKLLFTGRLWLMQLNYNTPLQPQLPTTKSPFDAGKD